MWIESQKENLLSPERTELIQVIDRLEWEFSDLGPTEDERAMLQKLIADSRFLLWFWDNEKIRTILPRMTGEILTLMKSLKIRKITEGAKKERRILMWEVKESIDEGKISLKTINAITSENAKEFEMFQSSLESDFYKELSIQLRDIWLGSKPPIESYIDAVRGNPRIKTDEREALLGVLLDLDHIDSIWESKEMGEKLMDWIKSNRDLHEKLIMKYRQYRAKDAEVKGKLATSDFAS